VSRLLRRALARLCCGLLDDGSARRRRRQHRDRAEPVGDRRRPPPGPRRAHPPGRPVTGSSGAGPS
jgi:hypothetical protein